MRVLDLDIIGTHLQIQVDISSSCDEDFSLIRERLSSFESKFSRFIPGNWLHILNQERQGILDGDAHAMLSAMLEVARLTDGYFDPTVGKKLAELGYGNPKVSIQNVSSSDGYGDYRDIEIVNTGVVLHGNIELEFGGVGKGYLIDVIKEILDKYPRFLINFGGDMYGRGGWHVGLESPFTPDEIIGVIALDDMFLACSAGTRRKWGVYHHLIDPHTGESAFDVVASYVNGGSGILTDAYATALSVMPWEKACSTLADTPDISGVLVSQEGDIFQKEHDRAEIFV